MLRGKTNAGPDYLELATWLESRRSEALRPSLSSILPSRMWVQVFIRSYVVVARPAEEVGTEIESGAERWLPDLAKEANGDGEKLLSELGFDLGSRRIARRIEVEIGQASVTAGVIFMPIRWHAASESALFPTLEGALEIAELGHNRTQLGISANYKPPLGLVGKVADRALFHRVAEVTVTDFLKRIGARLEGTG